MPSSRCIITTARSFCVPSAARSASMTAHCSDSSSRPLTGSHEPNRRSFDVAPSAHGTQAERELFVEVGTTVDKGSPGIEIAVVSQSN
jgi:hypothetical protein